MHMTYDNYNIMITVPYSITQHKTVGEGKGLICYMFSIYIILLISKSKKIVNERKSYRIMK